MSEKVKCEYCGKEYSKMGIATHIWRSHGEGQDHNPNIGYENGRTIWNKGLTKETSDSVLKMANSVSETLKQQVADGTYTISRMGDQARKECSRRMSSHNPGGRCKWYEVSGKKVQGTWERDFAIKLDEYNVEWIKPTTKDYLFEYELDNKTKTYTPDFYLEEYDLFIEIKGHWWGNDKQKMEIVLDKYKDKNFLLIEKDLYKKVIKMDKEELVSLF